MKLEDYQALWAIDAKYELDRLDEAARDIPRLHSKWWKFYTTERLRFKMVQEKYKTLELLRWNYWLGKLDDTVRLEHGWPVQPLKILNANVQRHLDGDDVLHAAQRSLTVVEETLKFMEGVIKQIDNRNYQVNTALGFLKFKNGQ